jgi:hypothetical protein
MAIDYTHETRIEYLIDVLATAYDLDDPYFYHQYEALRAMADQAMAAEARGAQVTHTWLIIPFYTPGVWGHRAVDPAEVPHGCVHVGCGVNLIQSRVAAVKAHEAGTSCREVR